MARWIEFLELATATVTKRWQVLSRQSGGGLGEIKWYGGWRRYCFFPDGGSLYEQDCLRDIADFCEQQTAARKNERASASPAKRESGK